MPLFGKQGKSPRDLVHNLRDSLPIVLQNDDNVPPKEAKKKEKATGDVSKALSHVKLILCGKEGQKPQDTLATELVQEIYDSKMIQSLIHNLGVITFQERKIVVQIFATLLEKQNGSEKQAVEYITTNSEILTKLIRGYEHQEIAVTCGQMLRECVRHEQLAETILYLDLFHKFFSYAQMPIFDIASDAFLTLKELLTRHKALCADFLEDKGETFFASLQKLLTCENYFIKRQALKMLGDLLSDKQNFTTMIWYVSIPENLKMVMNLLKDSSKNVQLDAFHVFKLFVANPGKPKPIADILLRNRDQLLSFLSHFHSKRTDDEEFQNEKAYLIRLVKEMKSGRRQSVVAVPSFANTPSRPSGRRYSLPNGPIME